MKHEKQPKHEQPDAKEPPRKEKKRRRKRGGAVFLIILLLILAILVLLFFNPFGWGNGGAFGLGGQSSSDSSPNNSSAVSDNSEQSAADTVTITIDNEDIYFDGELCDETALKEKIISLGTEKKYELEHSRAIKSAYDSVKAILAELEDALGITVNYNE